MNLTRSIAFVLAVAAALAQPAAAGPVGTAAMAAIAATVVTDSADLASTLYAINVKGLPERNPLLGAASHHTGWLVGAKVASTTGLIYAAYVLHQHGHPKIALAILWANAGLKGFVVVHNLRVINGANQH